MGHRENTEIICKTGHYECREDNYDNPWSPRSEPCKVCGEPVAHYHTIILTNGYDTQDPDCCDAPKKETGFTDTWHKDHYGNRYAVKHNTYIPIGDRVWKRGR